MRINYWIWHIVPGLHYVEFAEPNCKADNVMRETHRWFDEVVWIPIVNDIVLDRFGTDIGPIIIYYIKNMVLDDP